MRPIIGITTFITEDKLILPDNYITAVSESGGTPIILPKVTDDAQVRGQLDQIDGLLLTGGDDINPALFREDPHQKLGIIEPGRDEYETKLVKSCLENNLPVLAVCRGAQILNITEGGTMYQDIYDQIEGYVMQHQQKASRDFLSHSITIKEDSLLHSILGETSVRTNTFHHQANRDIPDHFQITAYSNDGVIEAIESTSHDFVLGIQWHPEGSFPSDEYSKKLFTAFVRASM